MRTSRLEFFSSFTDDEKRKLTYKDFTIEEINELIEITPLNELNRTIAKQRFIQCKTIQEIADLNNIDYKTSQRHCSYISNQLKNTCTKIFN